MLINYATLIQLIFFGGIVIGSPKLHSIDSQGISSNKHEIFNSIKKADNETNVRLPETLVPVHYIIQIQPFLDKKEGYRTLGYTEITINCNQTTNQVIFHKYEIKIFKETVKIVDDATGQGISISDMTYDDSTNFFIVSLSNSLKKGNTYILSLNFSGYLNNILRGFYRSVYQDENGNDVLLGATHFEPTDARRAFPCFDEPALKATFQMRILRYGTERRSISNMPRIDTYEDTGVWKGWYWDIFDTSVPMSSYLVAIIVSDFVNVTSNENDHVTFRVWARKEAIYQAEYAIDLGPKVLTYYEDYFNIPFPLPKQDMVALPDFDAGAMENWGLITYRETALLYDPELGGAYNKQRVALVIAHELAHQWFGDLVSPSWWSYLWLNEGFASYMETLGADAVEPDFGMLDQTVIDDVQYSLEIDSLESSHPIFVEVNNPDEIKEVFDTITYSKGSSILRMMNFFLTESTFQQGLTNYLNNFAYSTATQDDLWEYLTEQAHKDGTLDQDMTVKEIMDTWTLQMGYPVITVSRHQDKTSATVTQERFLMVPNKNSNDTHKYIWWVPLTYTTQDKPNFEDTNVKVWMSNTESQVEVTGLPSKAEWILFNVQEVGFYRVNYDSGNWKALTKQLTDDHTVISTTNRAQISDDSLDLARGGLLPYETALDLTLYIVNEVEYVPWVGSLNNLDYLEKMFTRTSGYGALKEYLLSLMTPKLYNYVTFDDSLNDPHLLQRLRSSTMSWTCHLNYEPCVTNSVNLYSQWMNNPNNVSIVSPNLKSSVYCTAIAEGDEKEWDFAWDQYLNSNVATDKQYLLYAMGCSRQLWILQRYLDLAFTEGSPIRKQDAYKVYDSVAENDYGRDLAWDYLRQEWDNMAEYYDSYADLASFTYTVTSEFNTEEKLAELELFRDEHLEDLGTATQAMDQAVENVQNNINWMDHYYGSIKQWLQDKGFGDGIGMARSL